MQPADFIVVVLVGYLVQTVVSILVFFFFFSSRRRHTRYIGDWSSDVCSSDLDVRPQSFSPSRRRSRRSTCWPRSSEALRLERRLDPLRRERQAVEALPGRVRSEERRVGKEGRSGWRRWY